MNEVRQQHAHSILSALMFIITIVIVTTVAVFTTILVKHRMNDAIALVDSKLLTSAELTREILGTNYHDRITDETSVSKEQFRQIVARNDDLCRQLHLQYLWSVLLVEDRLVFTSATHSDLNNPESPCASFFETHRDPKSFASVMQVELKPAFSSFKNEWGEGRQILIPHKDSLGRTYIFGASVQLKELRSMVPRIIITTLGIGLGIFCCALLLALILVRSLTIPIGKLMEAAGRLAAGDFDVPLVPAKIHELQSLSNTIDQMRLALKKQMTALRESESRFRTLFGESPVAIWEEDFSEVKFRLDELRQSGVTDFRSFFDSNPEEIPAFAALVRIREINQRSLELLGADSADQLNRELPHYFNSDSFLVFKEEMIALAEGKREFQAEIPILNSKGEHLLLDLSLVVPPENTNDLSRVLISFLDITERKQAEEALQKINSRLKLALNAAKAGTWEWDLRTNENTWSDELWALYGLVPHCGKPSYELWLQTIHPDECDLADSMVQTAAGHGNNLNFEWRVNTPDGVERWLMSRGQPERDEHGQVVRYLGIVIDITERKQAEKTLLENEMRWRSYMENAPYGVFIADEKGRYIEVNPAACAITGYQKEELLSMSIPDLLAPESLFAGLEHFEKVIDENQSFGENQFLHKNGEKRWWAVGAVKLSDTAFLGFVNDITPNKRHEAVLAARCRLLQLADSCSLEELLRASVDEAEELTGSQIGFYHFLGADQKTISLQTWSSNTLNKCTAEIPAMHYSAEMAGVWVDCIHERHAVIHNDYASLPHRKGVPPGHVPVLRELTVPVMRKDLITSVLGVGNKPFNYDEADIEIVASLADMVWDFVERKRAEKALREREERFRSIIENSAAGYFFIDKEGYYRIVNTAWLRMHKYDTPDEILGHHFSVTQVETGLSLANKTVEQMLAGRGESQGEFTRRCKDGSIAWHTFSINPVWQDGKVTGLEGFLIDITERKKAEESYQTLFREMLDGFALHEIICDQQGQPTDYRFLAINPAFERITGLKAEQILGRTVLEALPGTEGYWIETYGNVALTGEPAFFESYFSSLNKHFEVTAFRPAPNQFACIFVDITGRKCAEEEKMKLQDQLAQAQKMESVGRLAGGVAHDFNNMLGVILGHTELSLMVIAPEAPLYADLVEIQKAAQRSADLTRQLLAFARKQTIAPKILDLNEIVAGMLKMLHRLIGEDIDLVWNPGADQGQVKVDPSQIDQIVANLCVNARDAIAGVGKVTITTGNCTFDEIYCADHPGFIPGEFVQILVNDNGCGMDKETLAHIFEPFFTTKKVGEGTGLGLATIYGAVKQNNGFVDVSSEIGQGTTFTIYLPRYVEAADQPFGKTEVKPAKRGLETILLVEDEPGILEMTRAMLRKLGYTVLAASTPGEAIRLAEEYTGDLNLLMTDVVMPEMNGRVLAKKVLSFYPNIHCLFMSGYTADVIAHQGVLDEGVNFIQKPFTMKDLAAKVREVLDGE